MGRLIYDARLCTGCRACELACSFVSEGVFSPAKSRIRVVRMDSEGIDVPIGCTHCEDAPCELVCPVKAISRDTTTGAVVIDSDVCIGCKQCVTVCPFAAVHIDVKKRVIYKCDLCQGDPECVKWCFTEAIIYTETPEKTLNSKRQQTALQIVKATQTTRKLVP
ncbi:MAG: 4Fe-4S dicluster domain-containing protein [Planctomycetota bacterium]